MGENGHKVGKCRVDRASRRIAGLKIEAQVADSMPIGHAATRARANMRTCRDNEASQGPKGERAGEEAC